MHKLAQVLVVVTMLLSTGNAPAQRPDFRRGSDGDRRGDGPSREGFRGPGGRGEDYRDRGESRFSRGYGRPGGESGEGFRGRGGPMSGGGPGGGFRGPGGPTPGGGPGSGYRGPGGPGSGYRGPGGPGGGYRGPGGPGGGYRGPGSGYRGPSPGGSGSSSGSNDERAARFAGFLSGFDANKNGVIEPSEVPEERRRMLEMMLQRAGIESKGPIRISDLAKRMTGGDSSRSDSKAGNSKSAPEPLVPGFGVEVEEESSAVLAFGERVPSASSGASGRSSSSQSRYGRSSSSRSSSGSDRNDADARIKGFAQSMLKRYDRNKSGKLEKDEWGSLRGDPKEIDRDHNGVITVDEMAERLKNYSRGRSEQSRSDDSRYARSDRSGSDDSDRPASYRFKTSFERLPEGLPDWFARSDANADGQVAMAEYSSSWDDSKVSEFLKFDLNADGLITPQECLGAKDQPESPALLPGTTPAAQPSAPASPSSPATPTPPASGGQPASGDKPWWMS